MRHPLALIAGLAVSTSATGALAVGPEVIVSGIQTSPTSLIPGSPTEQRFGKDFNNLYRSPNGTNWIVTNEHSSLSDPFVNAVITGSGTTFTVPVNLQQSEITPWSPIDEPDTLNASYFGVIYCINDAGQWALPVRQSLSIRIVKFDNGNWSFPAIQGQPIPGDAGGRTWGTSFDAYSLSSNGSSLNFRGSDSTLVNDFFFRGATLTVETNVTIPAGQLVAPTNAAWQNFGDSGYAMVDGTGANWLVVGDVTGTANDDVAVLNGTVIAQQGATFLTQGAVSNSRLTLPYLSGNGANWYLRGTSGTPHWIAHNGAIIRVTGDPLFPGSTEVFANVTGYSRTFSGVVGDNAGNFVIVGGASGGALNRGVAVYNNEKVILADGDPIDLDSNGSFDDDVFVLGLAALDFYTSFLGEDGYWYATIATRTGAGSPLGEAIVRVRVTPACSADFNGTDGVTADDIFAFLDAWFAQNGQAGSGLSADFNGDELVTADDIFAFLDAWFAQNGVCS